MNSNKVNFVHLQELNTDATLLIANLRLCLLKWTQRAEKREVNDWRDWRDVEIENSTIQEAEMFLQGMGYAFHRSQS